jgi:hypothetical protein
MIKPIGAVSLFFSGLACLFVMVQNKKQAVFSWIKLLLPALLALLIWIGRNILLSGYLLYPLPVLSMPFDWTMEHQSVQGNYEAVLGWARLPGPGAAQSLKNGFFFWFKPWLVRNLHSKVFLLFAAFPSSLFVFFWFQVMRYMRTKKALFFLAWSAVCIFYWLISAPDLRFGSGFFWVSLGSALLFLLPSEFRFNVNVIKDKVKIRQMLLYLFTLGIIAMVGITIMSSKRSLLSIGTVPSRPVKEFIVNAPTPFKIWIPDDSTDDRTGNSPLPSAPGYLPNIEMREPGNLGKGFRIAP